MRFVRPFRLSPPSYLQGRKRLSAYFGNGHATSTFGAREISQPVKTLRRGIEQYASDAESGLQATFPSPEM